MSAPIEPDRPASLDTTPTFPPVEQPLIDTAARDLRRVLRNMPNEKLYANRLPQPPERLVRAEKLLDGIVAVGHERAAAAWGVHQLVQAGLLLPEVENKQVEVGERWEFDDESNLGDVFRKLWPNDPLRPKRRIPGQIVEEPRWTGNGPVPYEHLLVRTVPALWVAPSPAVPTLTPTPCASGPYTPADILQLLTYRRTHREHKLQIDTQFPSVMSANEAYAMIQFAVQGPQPGRLSDDTVAKLPLYRRLVKAARREYDSDLDELNFRCVVGDVADATGVIYDDAMAMSVEQFGSLMDRAEKTPQRGRGRRPASKLDPKRVKNDVRLFRDWHASGLSKKLFLQERRIPEDEGLLTLDRGEYHAKNSGNNSAG